MGENQLNATRLQHAKLACLGVQQLPVGYCPDFLRVSQEDSIQMGKHNFLEVLERLDRRVLSPAHEPSSGASV